MDCPHSQYHGFAPSGIIGQFDSSARVSSIYEGIVLPQQLVLFLSCLKKSGCQRVVMRMTNGATVAPDVVTDVADKLLAFFTNNLSATSVFHPLQGFH
ncbi:MAG: hypothetical protein VKL59_21910 [Nostocaceae cyanobacterium]|nr:hypothetical protein [Nostocaceae cyanobacterium]